MRKQRGITREREMMKRIKRFYIMSVKHISLYFAAAFSSRWFMTERDCEYQMKDYTEMCILSGMCTRLSPPSMLFYILGERTKRRERQTDRRRKRERMTLISYHE